MKTKVLSIVLAVALVICGIPAVAATGNTASGQDGSGIVARFILNSDNFVEGHGNVISNPDGSWTLPHADARTINKLTMAVPSGTYYFKFWLYVERAGGVQPIEGERWFFMENGSPIGDIATMNGVGFPDKKWTPMIYKITVPQGAAMQRLEYSLKGPMPWMINNDTIVKIGPEVVVSTNATPDECVLDNVLSYSIGVTKAPYNKINSAGDKKSFSTYSHVSATGEKSTADQSYIRYDDKQPIVTFDTNNMYNMGNLAAGTYYFKANTKIGGVDTTKDTSLPAATIYRDGQAIASFPSADEYTVNEWKENVIKFVVPDNSNHSYTIVGPQNAASSFSIARNFTIGKTDVSPLSMLSIDYKVPVLLASLNKGGQINTGKYSYDRELGEITMKSEHAADRFVYNVAPIVNDDMNVNAGFVPRHSTIYIKYKAKVSRVATTDGEKNTPLLNIEKNEAYTKTSADILWSEFPVANEYVTIVEEFDTKDPKRDNRNNSISVQGRWLGTGQGVDVTVSEVVISTNDDPLPGTTPALETGVFWPVTQVLPTFASPSANVIAVNVEGGSWEDKVAIRTIQGIVNKTRPRITVWERGDGTEFGDFEKAQRIYSTELTGAVEGKNCNTVRGRLIYLIWKFRDELGGYNKFSNGNATVNMANTAAYWNNGVPLNQDQIDSINSAALIGTTLPELINFDISRFNTSTIQTAYSNFYDDYKNNFSSRGVMQISHAYDDGHTRPRDFVAATGVPAIWLDYGTSNQRAALAKYHDNVIENHAISDTHAPPVSLGFFPVEGPGVDQTSRKGMVCIPTDHYSNYTHFAGLSREIDPPTVPAKPELENKRYITVVRSDGDNICTMQGVIKGRMWDAQRRGELPMGFTMGAGILDASPQLLQYYYDSATPNDSFLSGPSGLGYVKGGNGGTFSQTILWPSSFVKPYAKWSNDYFERVGINSITFWENMNSDMRDTFVGNNVFPSLLGSFIQIRDGAAINIKADGSYYNSNDIPFKVFNADQQYQTNYDNFVSGLNAVPDSAPGMGTDATAMKNTFHAFQPVLPGYGESTCNMDNVYDAMHNVASNNRVFVRHDHFFMLMREKAQLSFNVALQHPVTASSYVEGFNPENVTDGSFGKTHGWLANSTSGHLTVDLGKKMNLERFVVKGGELAGYSSVSNPKNFKVMGSNDGVNFVDISAQVSNNTKHTYYGGFSIPTTGAANKYRFVRLVVDGTELARVQEFEVWGFNHTAENSIEALLYQRGTERYDAVAATLSNYTNGAAVTAAYNASTAIATTPNSYTQAQIDTATANLDGAIDALAIDVTELRAAVDSSKTFVQPEGKDVYYPAEWDAFVTARDFAKETLAVAEVRPLPIPLNITAGEISSAASDLTTAIAGLKSLKGDINLDEEVTAVDALLALKHAVGVSVLTEPKPLWAGDVNYVNVIDTESALKILRYVTGAVTKFE